MLLTNVILAIFSRKFIEAFQMYAIAAQNIYKKAEFSESLNSDNQRIAATESSKLENLLVEIDKVATNRDKEILIEEAKRQCCSVSLKKRSLIQKLVENPIELNYCCVKATGALVASLSVILIGIGSVALNHPDWLDISKENAIAILSIGAVFLPIVGGLSFIGYKIKHAKSSDNSNDNSPV
eukprot:NODE_613_length_5385_cov_1.452138.p5 type:complete len:182 gc:universal NODE_613_length_5385_cov_1.452138:4884-4339(-)